MKFKEGAYVKSPDALFKKTIILRLLEPKYSKNNKHLIGFQCEYLAPYRVHPGDRFVSLKQLKQYYEVITEAEAVLFGVDNVR